jgi:hypothetical protein
MRTPYRAAGLGGECISVPLLLHTVKYRATRRRKTGPEAREPPEGGPHVEVCSFETDMTTASLDAAAVAQTAALRKSARVALRPSLQYGLAASLTCSSRARFWLSLGQDVGPMTHAHGRGCAFDAWG